MKRKSFFVLITLVIMLAVSPLSVLASGTKTSKAELVNFSSSTGVKRTIDKDFAIAPIGKPISPTKMNTAPPPPRKQLASGNTRSLITPLSSLSNYILIMDAEATVGTTKSKQVVMYGDTYNFKKVEAITHVMSLHQYDGSNWTRYLDYPSSKVTNSYSHSTISNNLTVPRGYYYETELFSMVEDGKRTELITRYSGALYLSN